MATKTVKVQDLSLEQLREQAISVDAHYADQDLQALQQRHDIIVQQLEGGWVAGVGQVASELRSVATGASQEEAVLRSLVQEHNGAAVELPVAPTARAVETTKAKWPYPQGHRRYGEPKEPSTAAVWRMLNEDHGIPVPTVKQKIDGEFNVEVGDYDFNTKSFPVWLHVPGAAYPEKYAYKADPLVDMSSRVESPRFP